MASPKKTPLKLNPRRASGRPNEDFKNLLSLGEIQDVPLDQVKRDEGQPRPLEEVMDGINDFADELERDNFKLAQYPVFHIEEDGSKTIVVGERRVTAFRLKERETIPAVCKRFTPEEREQLFILQYVENDGKLKKELSPIADARWWRTYADRYHDGVLSAAAKARGRTPAEVSNRVSLLDADPVIQAFVQRVDLKDPATYAALKRLDKIGSKRVVEQVISDYDQGQIKGSLRNYVEHLARDMREGRASEGAEKTSGVPTTEPGQSQTKDTSPAHKEPATANKRSTTQDKEKELSRGEQDIDRALDLIKRSRFQANVLSKVGDDEKPKKYEELLGGVSEAIDVLERVRSGFAAERTKLMTRDDS